MLFNECARKEAVHIHAVEWSSVGSLPPLNESGPHPGLAGALAGFHNDVLIIGGGANYPDSMPWLGGKKRYHDALYVFERSGNNYQLLETLSFKLPFPVAYGASCSTSKGVLYAGGENETGRVSSVMLVRFEGKSRAITIDSLPDLPDAVANASIACDGSKVYLAGGETADGISRQLLGLDLENLADGWIIITELPYAASHSVLVVAGTQTRRYLYLIGGRKKNDNGISDFFSFNTRMDLETNQWDERAPLPYGLSAGTGYSTGSEILLFGGDRGETFQTTESLLAAISTERNLSEKDSLTRRKNQIQERHPGFSREILKYLVEKDKWVAIGQFPFDTPVTTTALCAGNLEILIPSGEIRAGVRTPGIIEGRLTADTPEQ